MLQTKEQAQQYTFLKVFVIFIMTSVSKDICVESYSKQTLIKYGITDEIIRHASIDAFWDDPLTKWIIPMIKDRDENKYDSIYSIMISATQRNYNEKSIAPDVLINHPNAKSFICFYNDALTDNHRLDSNSNDETSEFKYAGSISVCPPSASPNLHGFYDFFDDKYYQEGFNRALTVNPWVTIKDLIIDGTWIELNKKMLFDKIKSRLGCYWFMEVVTIDPKWHGRGIGSKFIQNIWNEYIIPISKKPQNNYNGFCLLGTGNPRTVRFYSRNGYQVLTRMKLTPKTTDTGELLDNVEYIWLLWHWDKKKLSQMIDELNNEYGIDKEYKMQSLAKCIKYSMLPKWLQWVPIRLTLLVTVIILGGWVYHQKNDDKEINAVTIKQFFKVSWNGIVNRVKNIQSS